MIMQFPPNLSLLHGLQNLLLEFLVVYWLARIISSGLAMKTKKGAEIEFRRLKELDLSYMDLQSISFGYSTRLSNCES